MKQDQVIDYAYPMMMAERAIKEAHDCFLHGDYDSGLEHLDEASVQIRITRVSARHMKEEKNALREQAQTV